MTYCINLTIAAIVYANVKETRKIMVIFPNKGCRNSGKNAYTANVIRRKTFDISKQMG